MTASLAPIFMCLIWSVSGSQTLVSDILGNRWLVMLGEASFGLYLIHIVLLHVFESLQLMTRPAIYPLYLLSSVGISVLSFYCFETPSRKRMLKFHSLKPKLTLQAKSAAAARELG
jgi:peptidoglycan/LPS O-acetylase OafA/YrhL